MYISDLRLPYKLKVGTIYPQWDWRWIAATILRSKQEYGFFFASFDPFTAKGGQSQNLNVISQNAEKQIVPTERTDEEVSVCIWRKAVYFWATWLDMSLVWRDDFFVVLQLRCDQKSEQIWGRSNLVLEDLGSILFSNDLPSIRGEYFLIKG